MRIKKISGADKNPLHVFSGDNFAHNVEILILAAILGSSKSRYSYYGTGITHLKLAESNSLLGSIGNLEAKDPSVVLYQDEPFNIFC